MMRTPSTSGRQRSDAGFTLIEMIVAMGLLLIIMAGVFGAMTQAMKAEESTRLLTGMNANLRTTMDLVVRDFIQIGQGLPDPRRVGVPNGVGAVEIPRPGPDAAAAPGCGGVPATFGALTSLPAVTTGPGLGPAINGECSDVITMLAADGGFDSVPLRAIAADGSSITVARPLAQPQGVSGGIDIDDGGGDDIRVGDFIMLVRGDRSTVLYVSAVDGPGQEVQFTAGDPFNFNQFTAGLEGTVGAILALGGEPAAPVLNANGTPRLTATRASRIRMITYFTRPDAADPENVRLERIVNGRQNTVGFGVETFRLTYDVVDGVRNWTDVEMNANDRAGTGACGTAVCSENQIKKVNVLLSMRSRSRFTQTSDFMRNTLYSQVAVRSMAFVDKYK